MDKPPEGFDATVDNINDPTIISIFKDVAAIPNYLIILQPKSQISNTES